VTIGHPAVLTEGISLRNNWRHLRVTFERYNGSVRVLVAEDDEGLRSVLERGLRENGYAVDAAADGARALQYLDSYEYEVAIIDWRMPKVSGLEVVRRLRRRGSSLPILMLTARDAPRDRVAGLDGGADDYLVKPFDFSELLARLRALRRRAEAVQSLEIKVGQLTLNTVTRDVRMGIIRPRLTATELALLEILMQRSPAAVSRNTIALAVWNNEADVLASNTLDVHLARLRAKIANSGAKVEAVRALGYRIVAP
jgi:DNA-binding response OmpR family regulator